MRSDPIRSDLIYSCDVASRRVGANFLPLLRCIAGIPGVYPADTLLSLTLGMCRPPPPSATPPLPVALGRSVCHIAEMPERIFRTFAACEAKELQNFDNTIEMGPQIVWLRHLEGGKSGCVCGVVRGNNLSD